MQITNKLVISGLYGCDGFVNGNSVRFVYGFDNVWTLNYYGSPESFVECFKRAKYNMIKTIWENSIKPTAQANNLTITQDLGEYSPDFMQQPSVEGMNCHFYYLSVIKDFGDT